MRQNPPPTYQLAGVIDVCEHCGEMLACRANFRGQRKAMVR